MIVVRQEVSNFDSSVVVHELELAINRALRLSGLDPVVSGFKYHIKCYRDYLYRSDKEALGVKSESFEVPDHFSTAFQRLTQEIHEAIFTQGQAFTISFLLSRFRSFLPETTDPSVYQNRTDKLEQRLKAYYGDKITIQNQRGQSKSSIVFSNSISIARLSKLLQISKLPPQI